jgi:hypothetical protein
MNMEKDINYLAYKTAAENGDFDGFTPGTWVAFVQGILVGTSLTRDGIDELADQATINTEDSAFIHQVNQPEPVIRSRRVRLAKN